VRPSACLTVVAIWAVSTEDHPGDSMGPSKPNAPAGAGASARDVAPSLRYRLAGVAKNGRVPKAASHTGSTTERGRAPAVVARAIEALRVAGSEPELAIETMGVGGG
jgi:hypothetical protein